MRSRPPLVALAVMALCLLIAACGHRASLTYIADGGSYAAEDLRPLLEAADLERANGIRATDAAEARTESLADLRQQGEKAATLADTLTSDFPSDSAAVPAVVEHATYEGTPAWIVIEAWGEEGGTLSYRRLWVISESEQAVLAAQSLR